MSGTTTPAPLANSLKTAIVAAADAHLASVAADVARVKGAVSADLVNVAVVAQSDFGKAESYVVAQLEALEARVAKIVPTAGIGAAVLAVGAAAVWAVVHFAL